MYLTDYEVAERGSGILTKPFQELRKFLSDFLAGKLEFLPRTLQIEIPNFGRSQPFHPDMLVRTEGERTEPCARGLRYLVFSTVSPVKGFFLPAPQAVATNDLQGQFDAGQRLVFQGTLDVPGLPGIQDDGLWIVALTGDIPFACAGGVPRECIAGHGVHEQALNAFNVH